MASAHFLKATPADIRSGIWFERLRSEWGANRVGLVEIVPEPSGDAELREAIETMLASNDSYQAGDRAVIHTRPAALDMACETAHQLGARGIEARIIFGMASLGREVGELIEAACVAAGTYPPLAPGETRDPSGIDPALIEGVAACYRELLEPIERAGCGHWIVPIGTAPDPEAGHVPALDFLQKTAAKGLAPIGKLRNDGRLRSHDIWLCPSELDVARLNEDLPPERHWTLAEWRSLIFRAMAVGAYELQRRAREIEAIELTIAASLRGGRLHYAREDGTDVSYEVKQRPIILDCGRIGTNSLGGTTDYRSAITNQPTTEVFVAPIEDSMNGVLVYPIPERTMHGVIRAPYRIEVRAGQVIDVQAPDAQSVRILRNYTGLEPYDGRGLAGDEATAFEMRRTIAEFAIAGFNPVMLPEIANGRLRPVTGLVLLDEKVGDHQAFGSNDQFNGAVPSTLGEQHVEHTDFVGGIDRHVKLT
jgi:hypothetical protein